jgi:hypothetical protein
METFTQWLVTSSADPAKTSSTIQGILIQYVGLILAVTSMLKLPLTESNLYTYITTGCMVFGGLLGIFGLGRKIYYEIKGTTV